MWSLTRTTVCSPALYIFAVWLHVLPVSGYVTPGRTPGPAEELYHLILPGSVLALEFVAGFMRYARASMLDVMREEYVTTARAKGLAERVVMLRHAFRNALLPIITIVGTSLPNLIAGAVIVETLFNWPGLGQLYFTAIGQRDYPSMDGHGAVVRDHRPAQQSACGLGLCGG